MENIKMSFINDTSEKFSTVFTRAYWKTRDPLTKKDYIPQGKNIVFGGKGNSDGTNLLYFGKVIENSAGDSFLSSDCWLDITFPHVMYITGTRGTGKSFDLGVLLEGISKLKDPSNIQNDIKLAASILIDTQNQFWTLKYPPKDGIPANEEQLDLLRKWNISPNSLADCDLYIPKTSKAITGDEKVFYIDPVSVNHGEWCALVGQEPYSPQGHILRETIDFLLDQGTIYSLLDMIDYIKIDLHWPNVSENARNALAYKLQDLNASELFDNSGLDIKSLLVEGKCNVFMLRDLQNSDKALVTGIIARQLFTIMGEYHTSRKRDIFFGNNLDENQLSSKVWLLIDEAHVVAPREGHSAARESLIEYVKRGRDAGLSLVLATQQPSAVDDRILSQVNISLSHRLTFENDANACISRIPTRKLKTIQYGTRDITDFSEMIALLGPGQCFIGDSQTSRVITASIRPRCSSHGGYSPE
jgi:uncharacterized protein